MRPQVVVMGVSGSGKSTVGVLLAAELGVPFIDGDELHPEANVNKMTAGQALSDEDRWPWLVRVGGALSGSGEEGLVVACSALRRSYRELILREAPMTRFVYLEGTRHELADRLQMRSEHFMPSSLLDSQLEILEPLADEEPGITVSIAAAPAQIVRTAAHSRIV